MKTNKNNLTQRTLSGLKWSFLSAFSQAILKLGIISVLAHLLPPKDFGLLSIALIFAGLAQFISQLGIGQAVIQKKDLKKNHIRAGFTLVIIFGFSMFILLWSSAPLIAVFFKIPELKNVLRVLSITFLIGNFGVLADSLLRKSIRFKEIMIAEIVSYIIGYGVVGISLALMKKGVWALVIAIVVQSFIYVIIIFSCSSHSILPLFSKKDFNELLNIGGGFTIGRIFNLAAIQGDNFVVGRLLGTEVLGLYSRAYQLIILPVNYFAHVLDKVLFPAMAEIQIETLRLKKIFLRGIELTSIIAFNTSILMFFAAPEIIGSLFGPKWNEAVPVLQILSLCVLFRTGYKINDSLARALGLVYKRAWRQGIYAGIVIIGSILGSKWGISGVAIAIVSAVFVNYLLMSQLSLKVLQISWHEFIRAHLPSIRISVFIIIVLLPFLYFFRFLGIPIWYRFVGILIVIFIGVLSSPFILSKKSFGSAIKWVLSIIDIKHLGPLTFVIKRILY